MKYLQLFVLLASTGFFYLVSEVQSLQGDGKATYYMAWDAQGACALNNDEWPHNPGSHIPDSHVVALFWDTPGMVNNCGGCLQVDGPMGSVVARIVDRCEGCNPSHIDLSLEAFQQIGDPYQGVIPVSWKSVPCSARRHEFLEYRFHPQSNADWTSFSVRNTPHAIQGVQITSSYSGPRDLFRSPDNQWVCFGCGSGPFTITSSFVDGSTHSDSNVNLIGGQIQRGNVACGFNSVAAPAPIVHEATPPTPPVVQAAAAPPKPHVVHNTAPPPVRAAVAAPSAPEKPVAKQVVSQAAKNLAVKQEAPKSQTSVKPMNSVAGKTVYNKGFLDFELPIEFSAASDSEAESFMRYTNERNRNLQMKALGEAVNSTAQDASSAISFLPSLTLVAVSSIVLVLYIGFSFI